MLVCLLASGLSGNRFSYNTAVQQEIRSIPLWRYCYCFWACCWFNNLLVHSPCHGSLFTFGGRYLTRRGEDEWCSSGARLRGPRVWGDNLPNGEPHHRDFRVHSTREAVTLRALLPPKLIRPRHIRQMKEEGRLMRDKCHSLGNQKDGFIRNVFHEDTVGRSDALTQASRVSFVGDWKPHQVARP